jgi:hypothetical protein
MLKFLTILAIAAVATAVPTQSHKPDPGYCAPASYGCATNPKSGCPGWQVCSTEAKWVYAGDCPPYTHCEMNPINKSPYRMPN